jgi:hypothetical protein
MAIQETAVVAGLEVQDRVGDGVGGFLGRKFCLGSAHVGSNPARTQCDNDDAARLQLVCEPHGEMVERSLRCPVTIGMMVRLVRDRSRPG